MSDPAFIYEQQQRQSTAQPQVTSTQPAVEIGEQEKQYLRNILEQIGANEVALSIRKAEMKDINERNKPLKNSLKQWMIQNKIPSVTSSNVTVNLQRKKKKATPKSDDFIKSASSLMGNDAAKRLEALATQLAASRAKDTEKTYEIKVDTPKAPSTKNVFDE